VIVDVIDMRYNVIQLGDGGLSKLFLLCYAFPPAGSKVMLAHVNFISQNI